MKYRKWSIKTISFFLILYSLYSILHSAIYAQQISLSISPPLINLVAKPGKSIMVAYQIENTGDPTIMIAKVLPFEPLDSSGNIRIKNEFDPDPIGVEGPIRFNLDNADIVLGQPFFIKSHDSQQLLLRMRVPDGAPEGDYYYTLLAESQPPPTLEGAQSAGAKVTIGSNILITVTNSGNVDVEGRINQFNTLPRFKINLFGKTMNIFDSNDKIPIVLIVENKGKNLFTPVGQISLRGGFGETAQYDIVSQNVLANSSRLMIATNSAQLGCSDNGNQPIYCRQPITLLITGFFAGLYKISTTINFGENSPNIFGSTSFIAIPFKLLLGFLIAISIGIFIVKKLIQKEE